MGYRARKSGVEILRLDGDLSTDAMVKMKNRLTRLLNKKQKKLLLDLKEARTVELAGLGILIDRLNKVRAQKGDIKLCNLRPEVEQALQMVGVGNVMQSYATEEEAIQSFAA